MAGDPKLSGNVLKLVAQFEARIGQRARQFEGKRLDKVGFDTAHDDKTYAALKFPCVWWALDMSVSVCTRMHITQITHAYLPSTTKTLQAKGTPLTKSSAVETDNKQRHRR